MTREDEDEDDFGTMSTEELLESLKEPADPKTQVHGDAGNLELWDDEFARELAKKQGS